jgi:hypothetical protein
MPNNACKRLRVLLGAWMVAGAFKGMAFGGAMAGLDVSPLEEFREGRGKSKAVGRGGRGYGGDWAGNATGEVVEDFMMGVASFWRRVSETEWTI